MHLILLFTKSDSTKTGQILFYILPDSTQYFAEMIIPQYNFGKVAIGQEVLLKFTAYPFEEFGSVVGKIEYISTTPSDSGYLAKITLPTGLITNHRKVLLYQHGLLAQAGIVTENRSLLERFYYNIIKQINRWFYNKSTIYNK